MCELCACVHVKDRMRAFELRYGRAYVHARDRGVNFVAAGPETSTSTYHVHLFPYPHTLYVEPISNSPRARQ